MPLVLYDQHASAADAFAALRPGSRVRKRVVASRVCFAARAAGMRPDGRHSLDYLINTIFENNSGPLGDLLHQSIKIVQDDITGDVVVFSDVYHIDDAALERVAQLCSDHGLPTTGLVHKYPPGNFGSGYVPDNRFKVVDGGYQHLWRGCLAGLCFAGGK